MCISYGSHEDAILDNIGEVTLNDDQERLLAAMRKAKEPAIFSMVPNAGGEPSYKAVCGDVNVTLEAFDMDVLYWYMRAFAKRAAARHFSVAYVVIDPTKGKLDAQGTQVFTSIDDAADHFYSICPSDGHDEGDEYPGIGSTRTCKLGEQVFMFTCVLANLEPASAGV